MIRMAEGFPILLAAEVLPPDIQPPVAPGSLRPDAGPYSQVVPILAAVLLVTIPVVLLLAFSRRRKRKRMVHRPRNPTLAETGGLPPPRPLP